MDREVAAEWFDFMMPDTEFQFVDFKRNIPKETEDSQSSSFILDTDDSI